jgi:asparagine synthase (glutamine-hydrolysing)
MLLSERKLAITYNGEIYNCGELRSALQGKGHQFRSSSDTEVLLHLYAEEGEAMLEKLRGMYAFAIWDGARESLFLARDPFGIKPLYWADDGETFRAASQVKGLIAGGGVDLSPEPAGHVGFFLWGNIPEPYTLYRGIHELPAGHCLTVTLAGEKRFRSFCSVPELLAAAEKATPGRERPHENLLRSALCDSIRHHLIADVPVGVFLSSGLDSTTIAALAAQTGGPLRTVTLGFEEFKGTANDETPLAEEVARCYGARHDTVWVTRHDFEKDLGHLLQAMDQPSSNGVNTYFISKTAAQAGLKVALSGLGGDELFGGYTGFHEIPRAVSTLRPLPVPVWLGRAFRVVSGPVLKRLTSPKYAGLLEYGGDYGGAYLLRRGMFMPWELPEILDADLARQGWSELQTLPRLAKTVQSICSPHLKIAALEMTWYMRHCLLRDADWASMAHSLEIRVPLVDVELLRSLAPLFKNESRPTKRDMAQTPLSALPSAVLNRPKTGFIVPVREWLLHRHNDAGRGSPSHASERGLRGWVRYVYAQFTKN